MSVKKILTKKHANVDIVWLFISKKIYVSNQSLIKIILTRSWLRKKGLMARVTYRRILQEDKNNLHCCKEKSFSFKCLGIGFLSFDNVLDFSRRWWRNHSIWSYKLKKGRNLTRNSLLYSELSTSFLENYEIIYFLKKLLSINLFHFLRKA